MTTDANNELEVFEFRTHVAKNGLAIAIERWVPFDETYPYRNVMSKADVPAALARHRQWIADLEAMLRTRPLPPTVLGAPLLGGSLLDRMPVYLRKHVLEVIISPRLIVILFEEDTRPNAVDNTRIYAEKEVGTHQTIYWPDYIPHIPALTT